MHGPGYFITDNWPWDQAQSQFNAADRIAKNRGITKQDCDELAVRSQSNAIRAWDEGLFPQVIPVEAPRIGEDMQPTGETHTVTRDQGMRLTTMESLADLRILNEGGVHTPGTSSALQLKLNGPNPAGSCDDRRNQGPERHTIR